MKLIIIFLSLIIFPIARESLAYYKATHTHKLQWSSKKTLIIS